MKKTIRMIIAVLSFSIMAFSGYKLWNIYAEYAEGKKLYEDYASRFVNENAEVETEETPEIIYVDFAALLAENKDIIGWIYSEDTPINYPIVQSHDNNYYLRRLLDGTYNIAGTIFMDYRNAADLTDLNTIIYGHNMKNGTMFGTLEKYMKQDYYEQHPVIYYLTPEQNYEIQVVAGYVTEAWSDTYHLPQSREEQEALIQEILSHSQIKAKVPLTAGDKIITLSTCAYDFEGARHVVIGRLKAI